MRTQAFAAFTIPMQVKPLTEPSVQTESATLTATRPPTEMPFVLLI
jgi:hypothetical protein